MYGHHKIIMHNFGIYAFDELQTDYNYFKRKVSVLKKDSRFIDRRWLGLADIMCECVCVCVLQQQHICVCVRYPLLVPPCNVYVYDLLPPPSPPFPIFVPVRKTLE